MPFNWFARLVTCYKLTTERLMVERGFLGKSIEEVELIRVRGSSAKQSKM